MISKKRFTINKIESSTYLENTNDLEHHILDQDMMFSLRLTATANTSQATNEMHISMFRISYTVDEATGNTVRTVTEIKLTT